MKTSHSLPVLLTLILPWACLSQAAGQAVPNREDTVVDSATAVLGEIMAIPARSIPASLLANAHGIVIIPDMLKGGFIIGVKHGRGVVVTRDEAGKWRAPMFVQITGGSVGWQVGVQGTDLVLVFRTKNSVTNLMQGNFTIGATASAAAGPVGREAEAATDVALKTEIYSYSRSRGLFAGVALDGSVLSVDQAATNFYYQSARGTPGQSNALPASAGRLMEQIAKYSNVTVPTPAAPPPAAPADSQAIRRQLAGAWQQLAAVLDAPWRTFLALPTEIYSEDRVPSAATIRASLDRFNSVANDSRYQSLTQRPEFQTTLSLLRQYSASLGAGDKQPLSLPPPPN